MANQEGIADNTEIKRPAVDPLGGENDALSNEMPLDSGHSLGGQCATVATVDGDRINRGGTLHHAGSVLRCRSAGALRKLARGHDSDGRNSRPSTEPFRPTLRAYSAPHVLHSALYPPKDRARTARRSPPVETGTPSGDSRRSRDPPLARGRAGRRTQELFSEGAERGAPCKHRQGGYLHRYKGFGQEEVSCPPVVIFRVLGGLGELPRRRNYGTGPGGKNRANRARDARLTQEPAAPSIGAGRRDRLDRSYRLAEGGRSSPEMGLSQAVGTEAGEASALGFPEGTNVPTNSPPGELAAEKPAWCSARRSSRPMGVETLKAWGAGIPGGDSPPSKTVAKGRTKAKNVLATRRKSSTRTAPRPRGTSSSFSTHNTCSTAYLPYSLERPVSRERTQAFLYTSN